MIRWSFWWFCLPMIRRSLWWFCLPTIRRSNVGFFAQFYRRSDDHISVFLPKITDDPTIKFRFFCRTVPTIRWSHFGFFRHFLPRISSLLVFNQLGWFLLFLVQRNYFLWNISHTTCWLWWCLCSPTIRRSSLTDDPMILLWILFTDQPTIIRLCFTDDPMIINRFFC